MTVLARAAVIVIVSLAIAACGGGGDSDEAAIEDTFRTFFAAFEDLDVIALENLLSEDCEDRRATAANAIGNFQVQFPGEVDFNVTGVEIQNLSDSTVEALPIGTFRFEGAESQLAAEGEEFSELVKVDDEWKFANCNVVLG